MSDFGRAMPRERMDALNTWKSLRKPQPNDGLLPEGDVLHLATAQSNGNGADELIFVQAIPDNDPAGSYGGRSLPRGVAVSGVGDIYLAEPDEGRVLYTRASLPAVADVASGVSPFVPLWQFPNDPGSDHPLNLIKPIDLCLIPVTAISGAFEDTLLLADAGRHLLLWVDRRQIVTRHTLSLKVTPLAVAAAPCGKVAVLSEAQLDVIVRGQLVSKVVVDSDAHSLIALSDGSFIVIGKTEIQQLLPTGRLKRLQKAVETNVITASFSVEKEVLSLHGNCEAILPLPFPKIKLNRLGHLDETKLMLVTRPRNLSRPRSGHWISQCFDGGAKGFAWHWIGLEADVPAQCRLLLFTFVSDINYEEDDIVGSAIWSDPMVLGPGTPTEFLIQRNKGRYLWLKIEAFGDGAVTPAISGIDLYGPRDSQLNMLPMPFHQDPLSADFLDRFLSLQDAFLGEALLAFQQMAAILQPDATPTEFLDWLGSWFDWQFLSEWDSTTRREMIINAMQFFSERGTVGGLIRLLRWHTGLSGALPCILEDFKLAVDGTQEVRIAGDLLRLDDGGAHRFIVVVPASVATDAAARALIERLIDAQKPAHTLARLLVVEPGVVPSYQARLGVDAILPDSRPPLLGDGKLGLNLQTLAVC